jgi:hypothetical protein
MLLHMYDLTGLGITNVQIAHRFGPNSENCIYRFSKRYAKKSDLDYYI